MLPFDEYPEGGRRPLGRVSGAVCRRGYGVEFMRLTGQTKCAYCGVDFAGAYETWLAMALDHVVPVGICATLGIPEDWREDWSNRVLACAACNGFCNRYAPEAGVERPATLDAFYDLRDRAFTERRESTTETREAERMFFEKKPWQSKGSLT